MYTAPDRHAMAAADAPAWDTATAPEADAARCTDLQRRAVIHDSLDPSLSIPSHLQLLQLSVLQTSSQHSVQQGFKGD